MQKFLVFNPLKWLVILSVSGSFYVANGKDTSHNENSVNTNAFNSSTTDHNLTAKSALCRDNSILDVSFGNCGMVTTNFLKDGSQLSDDWGRAIAIQSDGKIVVAGSATLEYPKLQAGSATLEYSKLQSEFAVSRYNPDGTLDPSFGKGGKATTSFGKKFKGSALATFLAIQKNGKIVVGGDIYIAPEKCPRPAAVLNGYQRCAGFALVRFNVDGTLDKTFGNLGVVINVDIYGDDLALQTDDKIVVVGAAWDSVNYGFLVVRYNSDGSLDRTFGVDGKTRTNISKYYTDWAKAVAIQPDGKIVVAGKSEKPATGLWHSDIAVVRYTSNGFLDSSFGNGGIVKTVLRDGSAATDVAIQKDGKIIITGYAHWNDSSPQNDPNHDDDFVVVQYNEDGSLDTDFGDSGIVTTNFGLTSRSNSKSLAVQSDGRIVVVGDAHHGGENDHYHFAVVRFNRDGTLDTSFGNGGKITTPIQNSSSAYAIGSQNDGKIIVAGITHRSSDDGTGDSDFALVRYKNQNFQGPKNQP